MENDRFPPPPLQVTETPSTRDIGERLLTGVITAAVMEIGQRPGIWQKMIEAVNSGAAGTKEGTASAFLFRAMVDRLLEEFQALDFDS